ncbi:MAG TPA: hypothetical protein VKN99_18635 [Polyangia bacterium]|nr:hypothetical protein [Polyangia bacterium]
MLRGEASYQGVTGSLTDAWLASSPGSPGYTYPSHNPRHRIDYIYFWDGARARTSVLGCENVLDQPVQGILPLDHIGVLCRFQVAVRAP